MEGGTPGQGEARWDQPLQTEVRKEGRKRRMLSEGRSAQELEAPFSAGRFGRCRARWHIKSKRVSYSQMPFAALLEFRSPARGGSKIPRRPLRCLPSVVPPLCKSNPPLLLKSDSARMAACVPAVLVLTPRTVSFRMVLVALRLALILCSSLS